MRTISPKELLGFFRSGTAVELIDVRTPAEYRELHVEFASLVPLDRLDPKAVMESRRGSSSDALYIICRSGNRALKACEAFEAAGYSNVVNVEGGTLACEKEGLPLIRGKKVMSLERQVRIAAGFLVVVGTALGAFVNPWFLALSAFVGCGLIFAGLTDTCGMGMMLAKMPWNQVKVDDPRRPATPANASCEREAEAVSCSS